MGQDGGIIKYLADAYDESESRGGVSAFFGVSLFIFIYKTLHSLLSLTVIMYSALFAKLMRIKEIMDGAQNFRRVQVPIGQEFLVLSVFY